MANNGALFIRTGVNSDGAEFFVNLSEVEHMVIYTPDDCHVRFRSGKIEKISSGVAINEIRALLALPPGPK